MKLIRKFIGGQQTPPVRSDLNKIIVSSVVVGLVIAGLTYLDREIGTLLLLGTFGATAFIVFTYPDSPFAQPRNVLGAHIIGATIGLLCLQFIGPQWWSLGIAVGLTVALMKFLGVVHPPATSNSIVVFLTNPTWLFLVCPTIAGALIIVVLALFYHNMTRENNWPNYW
jgi:CBS-domain-containing membrane protein